MPRKRLLIVVTFAALILPGAWAAAMGGEHRFRGGMGDGALPYGGLISDEEGNFYGTTAVGGNVSQGYECGMPGETCGTVFRLSRNQSGQWTETLIYKFTGGADGSVPEGSLTIDGEGNLYGTAAAGGITGCACGTVFRLSPNQNGSWTETTLYNFKSGADGAQPHSAVTFDGAGNLFGTTQSGGCNPNCNGTVFELMPGQSGNWTESVIYNFLGGEDGNNPSGVVFDKAGNLYGTTSEGGSARCECGTVFELIPGQSGNWTKATLYSFNFSLDGAVPSSGVILDGAGNLYGETYEGGSLACPEGGCGVIFELTPEQGAWAFTIVHTFNGLNGSKGNEPAGGLVFDNAGNLYGTTQFGGDLSCFNGFGCGTIFELSPTAGGRFAFHMIGAFDNTNGAQPMAGVIIDAAGNLYGTASQGGDLNCNLNFSVGCGVVFTITP